MKRRASARGINAEELQRRRRRGRGSERADRSADVLVDGVLQPARGDAAAGRDARRRCSRRSSAARPRFSMVVLGRTPEDIDEFMEKLEATGAFEDVLPTQEDTTDEGLHRLMVRSTYTGTVSEAPEAATPAQAKPGRRSLSPRSLKRSLPPALRRLRARRLSRVRHRARYPPRLRLAAAQDEEAQDDDRRPAYRLGASSRRLPDRRGAGRQHRAVCVGGVSAGAARPDSANSRPATPRASSWRRRRCMPRRAAP